MKYKKAFTLVELMATIAILSITFVLIWQIFFQGYKIFNNINSKIAIQDTVRNTIMTIEAEAAIANEILVEDKLYYIDGYVAKALLRLVQDKEEVIYLEVKINDFREQLWEVRILANTSEKNYLDYNSKRILIADIKVDNNSLNAIEVVKKEGLINMNFKGVSKNNRVSLEEYSITIITNKSEEIIIEVDE